MTGADTLGWEEFIVVVEGFDWGSVLVGAGGMIYDVVGWKGKAKQRGIEQR